MESVYRTVRIPIAQPGEGPPFTVGRVLTFWFLYDWSSTEKQLDPPDLGGAVKIEIKAERLSEEAATKAPLEDGQMDPIGKESRRSSGGTATLRLHRSN